MNAIGLVCALWALASVPATFLIARRLGRHHRRPSRR